jgi:lipopolysaccharide export system permease protein
MKTVRRLLYRDILASVGFVALAFMSLFFFIDFVDQIDGVGRGGRTLLSAVLSSAYQLPGHFYELLPIALLIGTIYSLARLAQSSEFTILRTAGLGPGRTLRLLATLGLGFAAFTFLVGDYVAPFSERQAVLLQASAKGGLKIDGDSEGAGAWLKERRMQEGGEHAFRINVAGTSAGGLLAGIRIFEFDADGRLVARIEAREGRVAADGTWTLTDAEVTSWPRAMAPGEPQIRMLRQPVYTWSSTLTAKVVAAAVLPLGTMTTWELWRYSAHLNDQAQASERYDILFWKKALYPLACMVMMALAMPFAYMHARAGSVSLKVFGGIMLGISFVLLNNLAGHLGLLRGWTPWIAAAAPGGLYLLFSLGAFTWLVRYR